jgi:hypothetical protein
VEVRLDRGAFKNPEVNGGVGSLVHSTGTDDTNGGIVNREFLVLLEGLAKSVQSMANQVFQAAYNNNA